MFGIGGWELGWLVVLAIMLTPPEKIPELSRKAARLLFFLRNIANDATSQLRNELGPEYADLELSDLHPKTFVQKHLLNDIQDELDSMRSDIADIRDDLTIEARNAGDLVNAVTGEFTGGSSDIPRHRIAFDVEAT
ncbi:MAG: sec-independent translocase [Propionibacterium sp.]|nr:sec-independent translocase [Propionibacterium sp.]